MYTLSFDDSYPRKIWFSIESLKKGQYELYNLPSDFNQILHWKHLKKFLFVCRWEIEFSVEKRAVTGSTCRVLHECEQVCTKFERNLRAAFAGRFPWASCRTWKTWPRTGPLFKLPSLMQPEGAQDVILADMSRQKRDSVKQTLSEGKCWHSESTTIWVCQSTRPTGGLICQQPQLPQSACRRPASAPAPARQVLFISL